MFMKYKAVKMELANLKTFGQVRYPLLVTMHFMPAALAAARPIALSSTTMQL